MSSAAEDLDAVLQAAQTAQKVETDPLKASLANTVRKTSGLEREIQQTQAKLNQLQQDYLRSEGEQNALWPLFLAGRKLTPNQAIEQNMDGIKDVIDGN